MKCTVLVSIVKMLLIKLQDLVFLHLNNFQASGGDRAHGENTPGVSTAPPGEVGIPYSLEGLQILDQTYKALGWYLNTRVQGGDMMVKDQYRPDNLIDNEFIRHAVNRTESVIRNNPEVASIYQNHPTLLEFGVAPDLLGEKNK